MKRLFLSFAVILLVAGLAWLTGPHALVLAASPAQHAAARLAAGPELESASDSLAIIRWTITNPGGTDLHFGIVHYGARATDLNKTAKSPNRRNPSHPEMIFRVRLDGLDPHTTYYYTVESVGATGVSDGVSTSVRTFKTQ